MYIEYVTSFGLGSNNNNASYSRIILMLQIECSRPRVYNIDAAVYDINIRITY